MTKLSLSSSLARLAKNYSTRARRKRGELFVARLHPTAQDKILDLGGGTGAHIASLIPLRANVHICDISEQDLAIAEQQYGFQTTRLNEEGPLPFPDGYFDIVFCSSVIEHVTGSKASLRELQTNEAFVTAALEHQQAFAQEIRRISRRYKRQMQQLFPDADIVAEKSFGFTKSLIAIRQ